MSYKEILSPNYNPRGSYPIERLTIHCVVGQLSAESVANMFKKPSRQASSNYIVGKDGEVVLCVKENCRAWTSGSGANDYRAITIETASDLKAPYAFNDKAWNGLVNLTVDIMQRNKRNKLVYIPDKNKALNYKVQPGEMLMTFHRWFQNVSCPGDWFVNHAEAFTQEVNSKLSGGQPKKLYKVQVGAYAQKANADKMLQQLKSKGFDGFIVEVVQ